MKHPCRVTLAILACCAMPAAHAADPLSSSYWEAAYLNSTVETTSGGTTTEDEVEGFRAAASIGLSRTINAVVDFDQRRYMNSREAFGAVGLGVHTTNPVYQFFGNVTWERLEFDSNTDPSTDYDDEGYGVEVGARYAMSSVELHAAYKYIDLGQVLGADVTAARYGAGVALSLSPWWALAADYRVRQQEYEASGTSAEDEYAEWSVGFRRYFPTDADPRKRKDGVLFPDDGQP